MGKVRLHKPQTAYVFGTKSGLLRFDGVRFVPQTDLNAKLPSLDISSPAPRRMGAYGLVRSPA